MSNQLVKANEMSEALERPLRIQDVLEQVKLIQQVMRDVMKEGEHYGTIPGCKQPSLLKPGAEKICFTFRLAPEYEVIERESEHGHREYRVTCTLRTPNGRSVGQGVGICSTMEAKYRFRTGPKEGTGKPVPHEYWNLRKSDPEKALEVIGGKGHVVAKEDGMWQIFKQGEKVDNDNPADNYNTVLKMAKKRAHVDAVLTATAASDIFTQDVEEVAENLKAAQGSQEPTDEEKQENLGRRVSTMFKEAKAAMQENLPSQPVDWQEIGVYFGKQAGPNAKSFEGQPLGELNRDQLEWAYNWMVKHVEESTLTTDPRLKAMMDGLLAWKRSTKTFPKVKSPMTGEEFQAEWEKQQAELADEQMPVS